MANIEDLLQKNKKRLEKLTKAPMEVSAPKKIQRSGPSRPWQENLPQYQTDTHLETISSVVDSYNKELPNSLLDVTSESLTQEIKSSKRRFNQGIRSQPSIIDNTFLKSSNPNDPEVSTNSEPLNQVKPLENRITYVVDSSIPNNSSESSMVSRDMFGAQSIALSTSPLPTPGNKSNCNETSTKLASNYNKTITELEPNYDQTSTELEPNCNQSSKTESGEPSSTELAPFCNETVMELTPIYQQTNTELALDQRIEGVKLALKAHQTSIKLASKRAPNYNQTSTEINPSFLRLSNLEQKFVRYLFEETKANRSDVTPCISGSFLSAHLGTSPGSLRNMVATLKKDKGIITVPDSKEGRGGWYIFRLVDRIFSEMTSLEKEGKLILNCNQTSTKLSSKLAPPLLSSSSILNTNTTEPKDTDPNKPPLPEEWKTGLDWTALEDYFGQTSINERTGVYRSQLDLPANADLKDSPPLTLEAVQNSIDRMTWDYDHKIYNADSTYLARSRLFGILNKRGTYTAQAPGFKTRKARQAEQLQKEMEDETRILKASQDAKFELVQMKWIQTQNLAEIRSKHPVYNIAKTDERLLGMIRTHFSQQNYSKVVMENITDHTKLRIDFDLIDQ